MELSNTFKQPTLANASLDEDSLGGASNLLTTTTNFYLGSHFPTALFWGPNFKCFYNDSYLSLLGIKHPYTLGKAAHEVWPEIWEILEPNFQTVYETGAAFTSEDQLFYIYRRGFMEECYLSYSLSAVKDGDGPVEGILCTMIETTDKVLGERRLKLLGDLAMETASAQSGLRVCETISQVLARYTADIPFSLVYLVNKENGEMKFIASSGHGIQESEIPEHIFIGEESTSSFQYLTWPSEIQEINNLRGAVKRAMSIPLRTSDKDDILAVVIAGVSPQLELIESYRKFYHLLGRHLTSTFIKTRAQEIERKRAEALAMAAIQINSPVPIQKRLQTITDKAREIIGAHQATARIIIDKTTGECVTTQSLSPKYINWKSNEKVFSLICQTIKPIRLSLNDVKKNEEWNSSHPLEGCLAVPLLNDAGQCIGHIQLSDKFEGEFNDADEFTIVQIAQMATVAILNSQLLEREKNAVAARDEFISIASHELKTPIQSLKLQLELTKRKIKPELNQAPSPAQLSNIIDASHKQVDRLTRLVEELLDISRIQSGKLQFDFEDIVINDVLKEVMGRFNEELHTSGNTLEVEIDPELRAVWNRSRIDQIFVNLLSNSIKYAPGKEIRIKLEKLDQYILIDFSDCGPGIPKEFQHLIFERYQRATDRKISGLGLGLYIIHEIVKGHKGTIRVESEEAQGTKFVILLPIRP